MKRSVDTAVNAMMVAAGHGKFEADEQDESPAAIPFPSGEGEEARARAAHKLKDWGTVMVNLAIEHLSVESRECLPGMIRPQRVDARHASILVDHAARL